MSLILFVFFWEVSPIPNLHPDVVSIFFWQDIYIYIWPQHSIMPCKNRPSSSKFLYHVIPELNPSPGYFVNVKGGKGIGSATKM